MSLNQVHLWRRNCHCEQRQYSAGLQHPQAIARHMLTNMSHDHDHFNHVAVQYSLSIFSHYHLHVYQVHDVVQAHYFSFLFPGSCVSSISLYIYICTWIRLQQPELINGVNLHSGVIYGFILYGDVRYIEFFFFFFLMN